MTKLFAALFVALAAVVAGVVTAPSAMAVPGSDSPDPQTTWCERHRGTWVQDPANPGTYYCSYKNDDKGNR